MISRTDGVTALSWSPEPESQIVATLGSDGNLFIHSLQNRRWVQLEKAASESPPPSFEGGTLSGGPGQAPSSSALGKGGKGKAPVARTTAPHDVAFSPNYCRGYDLLVTCGKQAKLWRFEVAADGESRLSVLKTILPAGPEIPKGMGGYFWRVTWNAVGTSFTLAADGGSCQVWGIGSTGDWVEEDSRTK